MAFCRIPPVTGSDFVWVGRRYGLWTMGALPPVPPVTFSQQLEKVTKESRRPDVSATEKVAFVS